MSLKGLKIAYMLEQGFEDLEFHVPRMRLIEEGVDVTIVDTGRLEEYEGKHGLVATPDRSSEQINPLDYDATVIPGGWAPDKLRRDEDLLELVRTLYQEDRIIGSICHAGWVPASAGIIRGHRVTGSTGIKDDVENAGGEWVDEPAFKDGNLVFGRVVEDIPDFCRVLIESLKTQGS